MEVHPPALSFDPFAVILCLWWYCCAILTLCLSVCSHAEAARTIETYKAYEKKPPDAILGQQNSDFLGQATDVLTAVKSVNKTDVNTLLASFGVCVFGSHCPVLISLRTVVCSRSLYCTA